MVAKTRITNILPINGTNCIQLVTIGGTPDGGSFKLITNGGATARILWSDTDLVVNVQDALDTILGTDNTLVEDVSLTDGIGVFSVTFQNLQGSKVVPVMTYKNSLTGTSPTVVIEIDTDGVLASFRDSLNGQILCYTGVTPDAMYQNVSVNVLNPDWQPFPDTTYAK